MFHHILPRLPGANFAFKLNSIRQIATSPEAITAFSTDEQGNVYVVGRQGMVYQLDLSKAAFDGDAAALTGSER
jgi:hypothetical protein